MLFPFLFLGITIKPRPGGIIPPVPGHRDFARAACPTTLNEGITALRVPASGSARLICLQVLMLPAFPQLPVVFSYCKVLFNMTSSFPSTYAQTPAIPAPARYPICKSRFVRRPSDIRIRTARSRSSRGCYAWRMRPVPASGIILLGILSGIGGHRKAFRLYMFLTPI